MNPISNNSADVRQMKQGAESHAPVDAYAARVLGLAAGIDLEKTVQEDGYTMGMVLSSEKEPARSRMIAVMHMWIGNDPRHDAKVIDQIRAAACRIRELLGDDAVAREYARRVGRQALLVLAELTRNDRT